MSSVKEMELIERLEARLAAVESELEKSKSISQRTPFGVSPLGVPEAERVRIRVHFGRVALARKPFVVTIEGPAKTSRTLTPIRASILLVLLMDLLERSESGQRQGDTLTRVKEALSKLAPDDSENSSHDSVRVALYRAGQFVADEFSGVIDDDLSFNVEKGELIVLKRGQALSIENIEVEITTSDQNISSFLDHSLATSPLARLRKAKTLFVPRGDDGQDRLLLELLEHEFPIKQTSLFYRPTIQGFPQQLLDRMGMNIRRRRRPEVAAQAHQSGRLQYSEILPRKALWDMIKREPGRGFSFYPPEIGTADVVAHLDHLIFSVRSVPSYELVLTDAFLPFYLTTFEITRPDAIERFVLFFQLAEEENISHVSTFALKDDSVFFSTQDRIVQWILSHPTTVRNKEHVVGELEAIREALLDSTEDVKRPLQRQKLQAVIEKAQVGASSNEGAASLELSHTSLLEEREVIE